jgi:hypothetical protein
MRLDTCLLADAATTTPDGKVFIHGGGITRLTPPALPWTHPMLALVLRFQLDDGDPGTSHKITLGLTSPAGEEMLRPAPELDVRTTPTRAVPGEESYLQTTLQFGGIPIATAGIYRLGVQLDGEPLRELPIAVIAPGPALSRAERRAAKR